MAVELRRVQEQVTDLGLGWQPGDTVHADLSLIAPFRYTALLWAILLGYLVFGDVPDAMMATGATIIVLSGLYTFHRERKLARRLAASASAVPPEGV